MKKTKIFILLIFIAIILMAFITNPNEKKHRDTVKVKLNELVEKTMANYGLKKDMLANLGFDVSDKFVDNVINQCISSDNYYLFSLTKLTWKGESHVIGIGVFGKIFISNKVHEIVNKFYSSGSNLLP